MPSAIFSEMSRSRSRVSLLFLNPCASRDSSRRSRSRSLRVGQWETGGEGEGGAVDSYPQTCLACTAPCLHHASHPDTRAATWAAATLPQPHLRRSSRISSRLRRSSRSSRLSRSRGSRSSRTSRPPRLPPRRASRSSSEETSMSAGARPPSRAAAATGTALAPLSSRSVLGWCSSHAQMSSSRQLQQEHRLQPAAHQQHAAQPLPYVRSQAQHNPRTHLPRGARHPAGPCAP